MSWPKDFKGTVKNKEPLKKHTTLRIGGPCDFFACPETAQDLKILITYAKRYKIPLFIIGAGSNILAGDKRLKGIVIRLCSRDFSILKFDGNIVRAGSGVHLRHLVQEASQRGLTGAEFLIGIPGTVAGALVMNAGAWGRSISELVVSVTIMDRRGRVRVLNRSRIAFKYRASGLERFIVLEASLRLKKGRKKDCVLKIRDYLSRRRDRHDASRPNAGCVFRNPQGDSAGRLIELCGLKGKRIGAAVVSDKHANFILNCRNARASDVLRLMDLIKRTVKRRFGAQLRPEIKIWK